MGRVSPLLVIGDVVVFLFFSAMGRAEHATGVTIAGTVATAAPFLLAWFAVGLNTGVLQAPEAGVYPALGRVFLTWLGAWPIGLLLRAVMMRRPIPVSFALVTFAAVALFLLVWRGLLAGLASLRG